MSFTTNIKNEINNIEYNKVEVIAELSAIINISSQISDDEILLYVENKSVARRIYKLIKDIYQISCEISVKKCNRFGLKNMVYIGIKGDILPILKDLSIVDDNNRRCYVPSNYIVSDDELKKAYLRGVFLVCGSINDPKTSRYHAEFFVNNKKTAVYIKNMLNYFNFNSKVIKKDNKYMIYFKESEKISDFIKLLNAYNSLFYYEDIRIYRDHKNMTNRLNNCEQANVEKTIFSSNNLIQDIELIKKHYTDEMLGTQLCELIYYRTSYPESSLTELADIMTRETGKTITKSGVNHRIRKLKILASKLR